MHRGTHHQEHSARPGPARAGLTGAALGAWLGLLTGLLLGLFVSGAAWLPLSLGGLLIGAVAGGALGFLAHWATSGRSEKDDAPTTTTLVELERNALPGFGLAYHFTTAEGRRVGVVAHLSGRRDLTSYADPHDPDRASHTVVLDHAEARAVAVLLGTPVVVHG